MDLPEQFYKENSQNIFIYHYVEEMIASFSSHMKKNLNEKDISEAEFPFLIRIRYNKKTTQKELVELFKVSEGYTAKLLRKFADKGYIKRHEDPTNRRIKIVKLTKKGIEKTDELIKIIEQWETKVTTDMTQEEVKLLKKLLFKVVE